MIILAPALLPLHNSKHPLINNVKYLLCKFWAFFYRNWQKLETKFVGFIAKQTLSGEGGVPHLRMICSLWWAEVRVNMVTGTLDTLFVRVCHSDVIKLWRSDLTSSDNCQALVPNPKPISPQSFQTQSHPSPTQFETQINPKGTGADTKIL